MDNDPESEFPIELRDKNNLPLLAWRSRRAKRRDILTINFRSKKYVFPLLPCSYMVLDLWGRHSPGYYYSYIIFILSTFKYKKTSLWYYSINIARNTCSLNLQSLKITLTFNLISWTKWRTKTIVGLSEKILRGYQTRLQFTDSVSIWRIWKSSWPLLTLITAHMVTYLSSIS